MITAVIAIGFGASSHGLALDKGQRNEYGHRIRNILALHGDLISEIYGESYSEGWGQEPAAWFAVVYGAEYRDAIHAQLHDAAVEFGQDEIAIMEGILTLVGPGKVNEFTLDPA